jgi:hypothetical protein
VEEEEESGGPHVSASGVDPATSSLSSVAERSCVASGAERATTRRELKGCFVRDADGDECDPRRRGVIFSFAVTQPP